MIAREYLAGGAYIPILFNGIRKQARNLLRKMAKYYKDMLSCTSLYLNIWICIIPKKFMDNDMRRFAVHLSIQDSSLLLSC